ncbi:helix-turn-helix domain-containing protein [Pantoea sp. KPR_PJ]|uniref:helix-turn-helix domain-containing protein n=1 Tax=Pantoea sp. KPR_PJ TaxID=2738375 RepID=UPI0035276DF5
MQKESTGERIRLRRKSLNLTQKAVAEKISVSHVAISQWEKEETLPRGENLLRLAEALGCAPAWLVDGEGPILTVHSQAQAGMPVLAREQLSGWLADASQIEIAERVQTEQPCSATSFAFRLWDNALSPQCLRGDLLIIDPDLSPLPGDLVLALMEGEDFIMRKYRARGIDRFELVPLNEDYPLLCSSQQTLAIKGVLIEWRRYRDATKQ